MIQMESNGMNRSGVEVEGLESNTIDQTSLHIGPCLNLTDFFLSRGEQGPIFFRLQSIFFLTCLYSSYC